MLCQQSLHQSKFFPFFEFTVNLNLCTLKNPWRLHIIIISWAYAPTLEETIWTKIHGIFIYSLCLFVIHFFFAALMVMIINSWQCQIKHYSRTFPKKRTFTAELNTNIHLLFFFQLMILTFYYISSLEHETSCLVFEKLF